MKKKETKKTKHLPGPFDFCPKHSGSFYKSCGCSWEKGKKKEIREVEPLEEKKDTLFNDQK